MWFIIYRGGSTATEDTKRAIFNANFTSYNLYTLFLDAEGIRGLAALIQMPRAQFDRFPLNSRKLVYYVIGSIGAGKSTAASNFRNLTTYDEWIDERLPELARPQSEFDSEAISKMDEWIVEQFRKKNYALERCSEGIHIVDRCPLDPLTFPGNRRLKAENLVSSITQNSENHIEQGHVILLDCDLEDLRLRNSLKHKYWSDEELTSLLEQISDVYKNVKKTIICTRGRNITEVAREIAKVVFLETYEPVSIETELRRYASAA